MKKHILILSLFVICFINGFSQSKLFKEAIKRGINSDGYYRIENNDNDGVTEKKMREYLQKKGYVVGDFSTKNVEIYGTILKVVDTMVFFSKDDIDIVSFNRMKIGNINANLLKNRGTIFIPTRRRVGQSWDDVVRKWEPKYEITYEQFDEVLWSGDVIDGFLCGQGGGVVKKGNEYIYIEGLFSYGIPQSNGWIKRCESDNGVYKYYTSSTSQFEGLEADKMLENKDIPNKLSQAIQKQNSVWYENDAKKLEQAFQNVKKLIQNVDNLSRSDYESNLKNDYSRTFINTYTFLDYDPNKLLAKAKDIQDVYSILNALTIKVDIQYNVDFMGIPLDLMSRQIESVIMNAINIANNGKANNNSEFRNFYANIGVKLDAKYRDFKYYSDADYNREYSEIIGRETASLAAKGRIDWDKTKRPSGNLVKHSYLLGGTWYTYKNDGIIYNIDGSIFVKYNVNLDNNGNVKEYYVDSSYRTEYNFNSSYTSERELFNAVSRAANSR